jgi:hypothetical protein
MDQTTTHASEHRQRQGNANDPEYDGFLARLQARYQTNTLNGKLPLFTTDAPELFEAYLAAFPVETRGYHKCHACRRFVERFGGLVTIDEAGVTTPAIWHEDDAPEHYKPAVDMLARLARRAKVTGVFLSNLAIWGEPVTGIWHHMAVHSAPAHWYQVRTLTAGQAMAEKREDRGNVLRALAEFRVEHVEQAVTLLKSEALYRAEKVLGPAEWLLALHKARAAANGKEQRENVVWLAVAQAPAGFCHPRSSMIGTLLADLEAGVSFETARANFASKMHPLSYQRPQAAPSAGNIAQAEKLFAELGLAPALRRRFARLEDVAHAALWLPKLEDPKAAATGLFSHLTPKEQAPATPLRVPAQAITWDKFARTVLPEAETLDLLIASPFERYSFGALTTACDPSAPPLLQWDIAEGRERRWRNPVAWYLYSGGSYAARWALVAGSWVHITAIVPQPNLWQQPDRFAHQGRGVVLLLAGARDTDSKGLALFPECLRSDLHAVRATIEAHSGSSRLEGSEEASACGLFLQQPATWNALVRAKVGSTLMEYRLQRWD